MAEVIVCLYVRTLTSRVHQIISNRDSVPPWRRLCRLYASRFPWPPDLPSSFGHPHWGACFPSLLSLCMCVPRSGGRTAPELPRIHTRGPSSEPLGSTPTQHRPSPVTSSRLDCLSSFALSTLKCLLASSFFLCNPPVSPRQEERKSDVAHYVTSRQPSSKQLIPVPCHSLLTLSLSSSRLPLPRLFRGGGTLHQIQWPR